MHNHSLCLPDIFVRKSYLTCGYFYLVFVIVVRMTSSVSCVNLFQILIFVFVLGS